MIWNSVASFRSVDLSKFAGMLSNGRYAGALALLLLSARTWEREVVDFNVRYCSLHRACLDSAATGHVSVFTF